MKLYAGQVRQRRQLRLGTQAGCAGHGHRAIAQRQQVANDGLAVGVGMGVEFEQSLPARRSQHVQRRQERQAAAEEVRAVAPPRRHRSARHAQVACYAAPFGDVGLDHLQCTQRNGVVELQALQVLAAGQWDRRLARQHQPIGRRRVNTDRLLQPVEIEATRLALKALCICQ